MLRVCRDMSVDVGALMKRKRYVLLQSVKVALMKRKSCSYEA